MGVARETNGRIEKLGTYAPSGYSAFRAYEDRQGTVWIVKQDGVFRATSAGLELVAAEMQARSLHIDHDGNLWVSTNGDGLYRFKDSAVRMFTTDDGLPNNLLMTVIGCARRRPFGRERIAAASRVLMERIFKPTTKRMVY